jgi:uncharacterized alkaline shock family protein YloU
MSEMSPAYGGSSGVVQIADEVIATIARTAALEAEGVAGMASYFTGDIASKIGRKKPTKGIALQVTNENVKITVQIMVKSGVEIQSVAKDVQQKIKSAVEIMTNYTASEVNVFVSGLVA